MLSCQLFPFQSIWPLLWCLKKVVNFVTKILPWIWYLYGPKYNHDAFTYIKTSTWTKEITFEYIFPSANVKLFGFGNSMSLYLLGCRFDPCHCVCLNGVTVFMLKPPEETDVHACVLWKCVPNIWFTQIYKPQSGLGSCAVCVCVWGSQVH